MSHGRRAWFDRIFGVLRWAGTAVLTIEGSVKAIQPQQVPQWLLPSFTLVSDWAFIIIGAATATILLSEILVRWLGRAWEWELIKAQLDQLSAAVFEDPRFQDMGAHRVTLFKYMGFHIRFPSISLRPRRWFRWCWAGWLVQVSRSGHVTQNRRARFFAPDDSDKAEGVAGMAWRSRRGILVDDLPAITNSTGVQRMRAYSERTWVPESWVFKAAKRLSDSSASLPRSMFGVAVEGKKGRWGVLVLDSRQETMLSEEELIRLTAPICENLAHLVDRV